MKTGRSSRRDATKGRRAPTAFCSGLAVVFSLLVLSASALAAEAIPPSAYTWTRQPTSTAPSARAASGMAYDSADGDIVLFGGFTGNDVNVFSDTWTWDGSAWAEQDPVSVPPGRESDLAADPSSGEILMFGGNGGFANGRSDTWTWDGSDWNPHTGEPHPSARDSPAIAEDPASDQVLVFGGYEGGLDMSDTWVWQAGAWKERNPSVHPSVRDGASAAYDAATEEVVLFGGDSNLTNLNDTWTWNGTSWTQKSPTTSPPARTYATMFYDGAIEEVVLFGGYREGNEMFGDTWTWNGENWIHRTPPSSPSPRRFADAAYDPITQEGVLFGGEGETVPYFGETWTYHAIVPPTATVDSPADGSSFGQGQVIPTSFSCADPSDGPGIESCVDSNGATEGHGLLDTTTLGRHEYTLTARSKDGRTATTTIHYTVDVAPQVTPPAPSPAVPSRPTPSVTITHHPRTGKGKGLGDGSPRYSFRFYDETPGVTYYCRVDGKPFEACGSPQIYRNLKPGPHVFRVKSVDAEGVSSAVRKTKFTVDGRGVRGG